MSSVTARRNYLDRFGAFMAEHREMLRSLDIPHCVIRTDGDPWRALAEFFIKRQQMG